MTIDRDALRKLIEAQPNAWRLNVTALVDEIAHLAAVPVEGDYQCAFQLEQCRCDLPRGHSELHECSDHRFTDRPLFGEVPRV